MRPISKVGRNGLSGANSWGHEGDSYFPHNHGIRRQRTAWNAGPSGVARELCASPSTYMPLPLDIPEAGWDAVEPAWAEPPSAPLTWNEAGEVLITDWRWQALMQILIILNALVIGAETDIEGYNWDIIENLFLGAFTVELVLKMAVLGLKAYFDFDHPDFNWNLFDFFIVSLGIFDFTFGLVTGGGGGTGGVATIFRIVRLMRILRIVRLIKFLKQLYVLAFGFALAAVAVFWVTFLMIFVLYVCSIILVRTEGKIEDGSPYAPLLHQKFGNIPKSMFTLFELMSSPNLMEYREVIFHRPIMLIFLIIFIIFGSFGMIALLTGVISETMLEKNSLRQEEERLERESVRRMLIKTCGELFNDLPTNRFGEALRDSIPTVLPKIAQLFEKLGVEFNQDDLFSMTECLDVDGSGGVSREEWRRCIVNMAEGVRPLQIMELYHKVGLVEAKTEKFEISLQGLLEQTKEQVDERDPLSQALKVLGSQVEALSAGLDRLDQRVSGLGSELEKLSPADQSIGLSMSMVNRHGSNGSRYDGDHREPSPRPRAPSPRPAEKGGPSPQAGSRPQKGGLLDGLRRGTRGAANNHSND